MALHRLGEAEIGWFDGALYVEAHGVGLLLDAPAGVHRALGDRLPRVQSIALSSGRMRTVGGLLALLRALESHRSPGVPLEVRFALGEERASLVAEVYDRGWPDGVPVQLDGFAPGETFDAGPFEVTTVAVRHGERSHGAAPGVRATPGVAFRVEIDGRVIAFVPGAAPGDAVRRACRRADVAVVEVGVIPWPATPERWRLSVDEALEAARDAPVVWIVGDDGRLGPTRDGEEH